MPAVPSDNVSEPRTLVTHPELKSHHSFPAFRALGEAPKSALERLLSVFADVRAGEGVGALLLTCNVFLLLAAYYLLRPARQALILTEGGAVAAPLSTRSLNCDLSIALSTAARAVIFFSS